ncbi:MAG: DUF1957 domain-containing protein [Planctomycetes bacterium]|nr:DUF1957 domain-containing protein [Planctomycetota bacterium]
MPPLGTNCIVLHGHLPWVHHPEHQEYLEEDWYLEALSETYLPLLVVLDDLAQDSVPVRLSIGLTPPLLEMFRAPKLREKADRYLLRRKELAEKEVARTEGEAPQHAAALHYLRRCGQLWETWTSCERDPVAAFRRHQDEGRIEILASCATHAILPLAHTDQARCAQVRIGVALYREVFGKDPAGFWLPECAYSEGIDDVLAGEGVRWVVLEQHGVVGARPAPTSGVYRPVMTPAGVCAFGRDPHSSSQVWAAEVGYPGDPEYRELYRDLGYDAPYEDVRPYLHKDGVRRNLGFKYHRITGKVELHEKQPWDPASARERARVHAGNYLWSRGEQSKGLEKELGEAPCVLSPYDMELFGHWWYEGPWFLEDVFRQMADPDKRAPVRMVTPSDVLREDGSRPRATPGLSTWGENGFLKVWLNEKNLWVLRHQHELERRMIEGANEWPDPDPQRRQILDQMLRELLLLQSSDWAFIISKDTQVHYARQRAREHIDRFLRLEQALEDPASLDDAWWTRISDEDSLFPGLDHKVIVGGAATRDGARLGS